MIYFILFLDIVGIYYWKLFYVPTVNKVLRNEKINK